MRNSFRPFPVLAALLGTACGGSSSGPTPPPPPPAAVASLTLSANSATVEAGQTITLVATPRDATGNALTGRTVTWQTNSPGVATVSNGVITGVSQGQTVVTATSEGKSTTASITVTPAKPTSCVATSPVGRLAASAGSWSYTTSGGWTVVVTGWTVTITTPDKTSKVQFWGNRFEGPEEFAMAHENFNGKHIKDSNGKVRSVLLTDGTLVTMDGTIGADRTTQVSIYDSDQTHRLRNRPPGEGPTTLAWSCLYPGFGEADEADGETTRIYQAVEGWAWEVIYNQPTLAGVPQPKVPGVVPLARTSYDDPNNVFDYYDDPRLGHT